MANFAAAGWQLWKARGTAEAVAISTKYDLSRSIERENKCQEQLQHSHKMESLGMLAGGIVHDFNDLLGIIQTYVSIMEKDLRNTKSLEEHLSVIKETVKEGTALTQQLLTVARQNKVQFDLTSINSLITTAVKWLESTLPKDNHRF